MKKEVKDAYQMNHIIGIELPEVKLPSIPNRSVDIRDFGAFGDGLHDNTEAIRKAILHISVLGGGKVIIPAGVWLTGPIEFKSAIELYTEPGALVLFSKNVDQYPLILSHYEGCQTIRCKSPLDAEGLENVAITGHGIFDGSGDAWRPVKKMKMTEQQWEELYRSGGVIDESGTIWYPSDKALLGELVVSKLHEQGIVDPEAYAPAREFLRPCLLSFRRCKRILLDGPTFQNSPSWCLHPWASEHITIRHITVRNPWYAQNGDGLDLDSCRYVNVENCTFDVGDDAICLKSGKDNAGREFGKPSEFISVRNCVVYHGHGGIVVGSEMSGGVRNVLVSDCTFLGTDIGIRFKSCRGRGGTVENIVIKKIRMNEIAGDAISFNLYYEGHSGSGDYGDDFAEPVSEETPVFRNIYMEDIVCRGAHKALLINGLPEMPIRNIVLNKSVITSEESIVCRNVCELKLENVQVYSKTGPVGVFHQCESTILIDTHLSAEHIDNNIIEISGDRTSQFTSSKKQSGLMFKVREDVPKEALRSL